MLENPILLEFMIVTMLVFLCCISERIKQIIKISKKRSLPIPSPALRHNRLNFHTCDFIGALKISSNLTRSHGTELLMKK